MKNNFTYIRNLLSGVLSMKKKIAFFLLMLVFGTATMLNAQMVVHATGLLADSLGADLNGVHTLFVRISPLNSGGDDIIDASFTLSLGEISEWADYSTSVRFNNHAHNYIDARNGGGFAVDTQIVFVFNQIYYLWLEIDVPGKKYSVHLDDTEGLSAPFLIASAFAFRKTDIDKLLRWSVLIQGNNHLDVSGLALVESVGVIPGKEDPTDVRILESLSDFRAYPNPFSNQVEIELDGYFEYSVYDLSGALLLKGISNEKCVIGEDLTQGSYFLKVNQNNISKTVKLIKY